ncbi:MAG TPA: hypothetical protein VFO60_09580, partial [Candidatus Dormibacteraeota bacterium]|nr:hypothetical protein [Candidatus Dormibacteraeota bacterium]
MTFHRPLNRPLLAASTLVGIAIVVFFAWTAQQWQGADALDDLGEMAAAFVGAIVCGAAAWRHAGRPRAAWALLGASAAAWGAGEAVWTWYDLAQHEQVPFPSLADAGFLGAVPLAVIGALLLPGARQRGSTRLAGVLDGLIVAAGLLAVSWVAVLHTVYSAGGDTAFATVLSIAYPAGDVVIATILVTLVIRVQRGNRLPILLVVGGLAGSAIADSSFAYLNAQGTYGSGNALDTGWFAGYLLLALGAFVAWQR